MPVKQTSSIDALLEALRQSGVNTDGVGNAQGQASSSAGADAGSNGGGGAETPHIDFSFVENFEGPKSKKTIILLAILAIIIVLGAYWWFHPPINIHCVDTWFFIAIVILLPLFLFFRTKSHTYKNGNEKVEQQHGQGEDVQARSPTFPLSFRAGRLVGGVLLDVDRSRATPQKYSNILEDRHDMEFSQDIQEVDYNEIPVIDRAFGHSSRQPHHGRHVRPVSQFEISLVYSQINYQDHPVRVSPLTYADLFKWLQNREEGIPAYVVVDMTTQDAEVVRLEGARPIKYSQASLLRAISTATSS